MNKELQVQAPPAAPGRAPETEHDPTTEPPPLSTMLLLRPDAAEHEIRSLVDSLRGRGVTAWMYDVGPGVVVLPEVGPALAHDVAQNSPAVAAVSEPGSRYRLVRREVEPGGSLVEVGGVVFGGEHFVVVAGPCAVESHEQILAAARAVAEAGATVLRGGAFKPRTSPYEFQGLGSHGVELLAAARAATGLPFVTEVMDPAQIETMYGLVDGFQVGARNMQHYELLKALADTDKPVVLKRNPSATVEEWLLAAEYLLVGGNSRVILCERGIRAFNTGTRYTLDLASVALAKRETHLPVIVDPSHATGDPLLVLPMARASLAAGADGVMVEVHPHPAEALSDGPQALVPDQLEDLVTQLAAMAPLVGRVVGPTLPLSTPGGS